MRIVLSRGSSSKDACARWGAKPSTSTSEGKSSWQHDLYKADVIPSANETVDETFERVWAKIVTYRIFPATLVRAIICPPGELAKGTLVIQRFCFFPIGLECAVRVIDRWDERSGGGRRAGLRYVTVAGHLERGVETFEVVSDGSGRVSLVVTARSTPGVLLTQLGRPFARRMQVSATQQALRGLSQSEAF
jgi:uncharacterized protein (UPF0548 family)